MLQSLREKTSGWIASVIMGLLVIPFAFFGIEQYGTSSETFVARVEAPPTWWAGAPHVWPLTRLWDVEEITTEQFRKAFDDLRQSERQRLGDAFDSEQFESADNKRKVLDQVIDDRIMQMASTRNGVQVSDAAVRDVVQSFPDFQVDGKFNMTRYQTVLSKLQNPMTPAQFEESIRQDLRRNAMAGRIASSDFVTPSEKTRLANIMTEQRGVIAAIVPKLADTAPVTDAEIAAWYKTHVKQYSAPPKVTLEYVDADLANFAAPAIKEGDVRALYESRKSKYVGNDQRLVSHILIQLPADAKAAAISAAEAKAAQIAEQARAPGADFAALAKANSDDVGSKAAGGDLGWISRDGSNDAAFEAAAFAMQAGQVSAPVRTQYGWHVIEVRDVKAGTAKTYEDVKPELEAELKKQSGERALSSALGELTDEAYKNPANFAATAKRLGLNVQTAGPIAMGQGDAVITNPAVQRVLFSKNVAESIGAVSDPIKIGDNHNVLFRVLSRTPERQLPLTEVRDAIIADVRADRANKAALAKADKILAAIKAGQSLEAVAAANGAQLQNKGEIVRGEIPTPEVNRAMFAVPRPAAGKQSPGKATLPDGNVLVFAVTEAKPGDAERVPAEVRAQIMKQLGDAYGVSSAMNYVNALKKQFKIKVAEDRM
ncbi:SurA N-terminal domain-containing protein [Lysobacter soyae]|uniref:Periplasmic chaperone PpiD n=1 Tax=Lysobacter soyae TaxID=2764185 RepID=A0ABX8WSC3_9GAMM|nr:SurA N-terminal domain-containing protein [Lysobacter sp. CJ11]QYR53721.1 SurA N-terminal domain-containing protein [Lysobacter sp. CJ11]